MKLGEAIYKTQQNNAGDAKAEQTKEAKDKDPNKENVVDADYEDVKDEDKEKRA